MRSKTIVIKNKIACATSSKIDSFVSNIKFIKNFLNPSLHVYQLEEELNNSIEDYFRIIYKT